mmetsp:Transcript_3544/g.8826  ORF Transcript_3544/g.8826 Transcript_3544/m.8826 type:complete len:316 (+) Transcript_3544:1090-2037(+)
MRRGELLRLGVVHEVLLVLGEVTPDGAEHHDGHDAREEQQHQQAVQDAQPVHLAARHAQVRVPARHPLDLRLLPHHVVRVHDLLALRHRLRRHDLAGGGGLGARHGRRQPARVAPDAARERLKAHHGVVHLVVARQHAAGRVGGRVGQELPAPHVHLRRVKVVARREELRRHRVHQDLEHDVVVHIGVALVVLKAELKAGAHAVRAPVQVVCGHRQVVQHQVDAIPLPDALLQILGLVVAQRAVEARLGAGVHHLLVRHHGEVIGGVLQALPGEEGPDVDVAGGGAHAAHGLAERQRVVVKRQLRLEGAQRVDLR